VYVRVIFRVALIGRRDEGEEKSMADP